MWGDYYKVKSKLTSVIDHARKLLQPVLNAQRNCVMMLVSNLASPDSFSINCTDKILSHILCRINTDIDSFHEEFEVQKNKSCLSFQILKNSSCLLFLWSDHNVGVITRCNAQGMNNFRIGNIENLFFVLLATNIALSPILSLHSRNNKFLDQIHFKQMSQKYEYITKSLNTDTYKGYQICETEQLNMPIGIAFFICKSGLVISNLLLCNGIIDCPNDDSSDEEFCQCSFSEANPHSKHCKFLIQGNDRIICSELYYMALGACHQYTNREYNHKVAVTKNDTQPYICKEGPIDKILSNDLYGDCFLGEDEPILRSLLINHVTSSCADSNQIPCFEGHPKCYNISDICSYKLNTYGHLLPCRNGAHLESCKDFDCNAKFKCPNYYCIPFEYVCDGSWDCPTGTDENVCNDPHRCNKMFKCKGTLSKCIHLGNICDNMKNCPLGDDEFLCEVKDITCPVNCQCLSLAISCRQGNLPAAKVFLPFMYISLYNSKDITFSDVITRSPNVNYLKLRFNNIQMQDICNCWGCGNLLHFDVAFNLIQIIRKQCSQTYYLLTALNVNDNLIKYIEDKSFTKLHNLKFVNLSNNDILNIPQFIFFNTQLMNMISIKNNPLRSIHENALQNVNIKIIESTSYQICCIVHQAKCSAQKPWYISCSDLLSTSSIKFIYILMSIFIMFVNTLSICSHIVLRKSSTSYFITIASVNITDMLCGLYLCVIWIGDLYFRGKFISHERYWRSSFLCFTAFGLSLWFSVVAPLILLFLSLSRLMIVVNPLSVRFKTTKSIFKFLFAIILVSMSVSIVLTLLIRFTQERLPLSLCLPFVDPTNSILLIKIIAWCTAIIQVTISVFILALHSLLVQYLRKYQMEMDQNKNKENSDKTIIIQLALITVSNIICWLPTNIIYLTSLFLPRYPTDLVIWTTVLVTPLNSMINPTVFAVTLLRGFSTIKISFSRA